MSSIFRSAALITALTLVWVSRAAVAAVPVVAQEGDLDMSCAQLAEEVVYMENVMIEARDIKDDTRRTGTGLGVAKAVGGFLVGSIPGAIGVMVAGEVADEVTEDKIETAEEREDIADQRRNLLAGIYYAKGCQGPLASPLQAAALEPASGTPDVNPSRKPRYNN